MPSRPDIASEAEREESRTAFIAVVAWITAATPSRASPRASSAASADWRAASADASTAWLISAAERVALETMRSWASAPDVISVMAPAISATARLDSSEVRVTASEEC